MPVGRRRPHAALRAERGRDPLRGYPAGEGYPLGRADDGKGVCVARALSLAFASLGPTSATATALRCNRRTPFSGAMEGTMSRLSLAQYLHMPNAALVVDA